MGCVCVQERRETSERVGVCRKGGKRAREFGTEHIEGGERKEYLYIIECRDQLNSISYRRGLFFLRELFLGLPTEEEPFFPPAFFPPPPPPPPLFMAAF